MYIQPKKSIAEIEEILDQTSHGTFQLNMVPGESIRQLSTLKIDNPSEVIVNLTQLSSRPTALVHVIDHAALLIRSISFAKSFTGWEPTTHVKYNLVLPPAPELVLEKLKTAIFPAATIDLETLSRCTNAAITSIGIVVGDLATGEIFTWFHVEVPLLGQGMRKQELATVKFWQDIFAKHPEMEDLVTLGTDAVRPTVGQTLIQINAFFDSLGEYKKQLEIFTNGPEFDSTNLDTLYRQHDDVLPWQFRRNESVRTAVLFGRRLLGIDPKYKERPGLYEHFALHDALREFHYVSEIVQAFQTRLGPIEAIKNESVPSQ